MSTYPPPATPPAPGMPYYQKDSTLAIVSLVTGISAYVFLPFIGALAAVITGHLASSEIKKSNGMVKGQGMATAGLVLGYVQLGLTLLAVIFIIILAALAPQFGSVFSDINSGMYY